MSNRKILATHRAGVKIGASMELDNFDWYAHERVNIAYDWQQKFFPRIIRTDAELHTGSGDPSLKG